MALENIEFEITIDTRGTPFTQDDVYKNINTCISNVSGWENSIKEGEVKVHPAASFGPEQIAIISLTVATSGLTYNIVRNFFKDRAEKLSKQAEKDIKQKEISLQEDQIRLLTDLSAKLDKVEKQLKNYGKVTMKVKNKKTKE